jgi:epoxyqueuosine reductase QueG
MKSKIAKKIFSETSEETKEKAKEYAKKRLHCKHPREQRSYIGNNLLRCNVCGLEFS